MNRRPHREVLANITFERRLGAEEEEAEAQRKQRKLERSKVSNVKESNNNQPNEATLLVIQCMKEALAQSISSISVKEKERPLNPRRDFSFKSRILFEAVGVGVKQRRIRAGVDAGCCSAGNVKGDVLDSDSEADAPESDEDAHSSGDDENELKEFYAHNADPARKPSSQLVASATEPTVEEIPVFNPGMYHNRTPSILSGHPPPAQQPAVSPAREAFTFTDYAPMCYRHIREFFNIDSRKYRDVLCYSGWHSIPTPGKSAAQLFFCGQNWVIKTMNREESKFLRAILHRYYDHVRDNPYTLLPHFVGHHSIVVRGEKITFVIMQNVFATPNKIREKFDLKGSTVGRYVSAQEKRKATVTKKDLDINRPLNIGPRRRELLIRQLQADCEFLSMSQIMDYSFLIGIHHIPKGTQIDEQLAAASEGLPCVDPSALMSPESSLATPNDSFCATMRVVPRGDDKPKDAADPLDGNIKPAVPELDESCFTMYQGGMLSCAPPPGSHDTREIYYVGIIDILQEYNTRKTVETMIRSITNEKRQISSVDPQLYAARFVSFMSSVIV